MTAPKFREFTRQVLATISFTWLQTKPELLQTYHQLALDTTPTLCGMKAPFDTPVQDLIMNTVSRPSEMQTRILGAVVPVVLVGIQSLAEASLQDATGCEEKAFARIERLFASHRIDRNLASEAHHWRMIRNVVAHAGGLVDERTANEAQRLASKGQILFRGFHFWGELLDAGHGGTLVPVTKEAATAPRRPYATSTGFVEIIAGTRLSIGVGDLLAASEVWGDLISSAE